MWLYDTAISLFDENSYEICISVLNSITCRKSLPSPLEYKPGKGLGSILKDLHYKFEIPV
jgi:hypothetical protein